MCSSLDCGVRDMEGHGLNITAIILARGGSVGLFKKNIRPLLGKPLIYYTIKAAQESKHINDVIVSTDNKEIADIAINCGAEVPFLRPEEYSSNESSSESALLHAVEWLEEAGRSVDIVVYLQVTDIFRQRGIVDLVIEELIKDSTVESCFVAHPTHKKFWELKNGEYNRLSKKEYAPRQEGSVLFREDTGIACATKVEIIKQGFRLGDNIKIIENDDFNSCIDIHEEETFWLAEQLLKRDNGKKYYI